MKSYGLSAPILNLKIQNKKPLMSHVATCGAFHVQLNQSRSKRPFGTSLNIAQFPQKIIQLEIYRNFRIENVWLGLKIPRDDSYIFRGGENAWQV